MKTLIQISAILLFLSPALLAQNTCEDLIGVWQYENVGRKGIYIMSPTHYIAITVNDSRIPFKGGEPTQAEKAAAFEALNFVAGTWTCSGNQGVLHLDYAAIPELTGTSITYDYELIGNVEHYWVIQPDGSRGPLGKGRKIAEWEEVSQCSNISGVWDHLDLNGLFIQAGPYAAWVIVDEDQATLAADVESVQGKAQAYDAVSASFAVSTCRPEGKTDHILLSTDPGLEGLIRAVDLEWQQDHIRGWVLNPNGSRIGDGLRIAPVKTSDAKYDIPQRTFQNRHQALLYQITGAFTGALNIAKQNGISAEDFGRQLGQLYKHSWNKEAGVAGYIRGMLFNSVSFSYAPADVEIISQSNTSIEYKWKMGSELVFKDGQLFGTSLDDFYAFFYGVMDPISEYLGATYEQKRLEDGWLLVAIRKR